MIKWNKFRENILKKFQIVKPNKIILIIISVIFRWYVLIEPNGKKDIVRC